jgi:hypothetical protein
MMLDRGESRLRRPADAGKLRVWSLVTPSHETLLADWFRRTLPGDCASEVRRIEATPADYGAGHWNRIVVHKFDVLDEAFDAEADETVFVLSDVDIRFHRPFAADVRRRIDGLDVLFQHNRPGEANVPSNLCSGFMVIRSGERARAFFRAARARLEAADRSDFGDQRACINTLEAEPGALRWGLLPETYWVPYDDGRHWRPGDPLRPPRGLVLHHANWTIGVPHKLAQLRDAERALAAAVRTGGS